jgi:outer membrane protein assembly factor BamB
MFRPRFSIFAAAGVVAATTAGPALAAGSYERVHDFSEITSALGSKSSPAASLSGVTSINGKIYASVFDAFGGGAFPPGSGGQKVDRVGIVEGPDFQPLVSETELIEGGAPLKGFQVKRNLSAIGDDLVFNNRQDNAIYRVDTNNGQVSKLMTSDQIKNSLPDNGMDRGSQTLAQTTYDGNLIWYNSSSDRIVQNPNSSDPSQLDVALPTNTRSKIENQLSSFLVEGLAAGGDRVYFGNSQGTVGGLRGSNPGRLHSFDLTAQQPRTTLETEVGQDALQTLTGESDAEISNVLFGGDGNVYFREGETGSIFSFDPDTLSDEDPASSIQTVLTGTQIKNDGPASTSSPIFGDLLWHDDQLHFYQTRGEGGGIYIVPEPTSLMLLGAGGVMLGLRRRRRARAAETA